MNVQRELRINDFIIELEAVLTEDVEYDQQEGKYYFSQRPGTYSDKTNAIISLATDYFSSNKQDKTYATNFVINDILPYFNNEEIILRDRILTNISFLIQGEDLDRIYAEQSYSKDAANDLYMNIRNSEKELWKLNGTHLNTKEHIVAIFSITGPASDPNSAIETKFFSVGMTVDIAVTDGVGGYIGAIAVSHKRAGDSHEVLDRTEKFAATYSKLLSFSQRNDVKATAAHAPNRRRVYSKNESVLEKQWADVLLRTMDCAKKKYSYLFASEK